MSQEETTNNVWYKHKCLNKTTNIYLLITTAGAAGSSGNNGRLTDDGNNQQQKPIANLLSSANDSAVKMPLPTATTPGGYMTLPLNKSSVTMSGNRHPPAIDQGHFLRRVTTMEMLLAHLSSNSPIITRNNSAHCRGTTNNNMIIVHLLNNSSFNFWCLVI